MAEAGETELAGTPSELDLDASRLGLWVFLTTEALLFGGLFAVFLVYRFVHFEAFAAACRKLDLPLGALNTGVLLTSSLTMALAVRAAKGGQRGATAAWLGATALLGSAFLGVKGLEWSRELGEGLWPGRGFAWDGPYSGGARLYFALYFCMTGLHALHMLVGLAAVAFAVVWRRRAETLIENVGLYWHFVDVVWIWLFPMLYLFGRAK